MPGPFSLPSSYEYKPLPMEQGLAVREKLQANFDATSTALDEAEVLAYKAVGDSKLDPQSKEPYVEKIKGDIGNLRESLSTQKDIKNTIRGIRDLQGYLQNDPELLERRAILETEMFRMERHAKDLYAYDPHYKKPFDQLKKEGVTNDMLLTEFAGSYDGLTEVGKTIKEIPNIKEVETILARDGRSYTSTTVSNILSDPASVEQYDEYYRTKAFSRAREGLLNGIASRVQQGSSPMAKQHRLRGQYEEDYDPLSEYSTEFFGISGLYERGFDNLERSKEEEKDPNSFEERGVYNIEGTRDATFDSTKDWRALSKDKNISSQERERAMRNLQMLDLAIDEMQDEGLFEGIPKEMVEDFIVHVTSGKDPEDFVDVETTGRRAAFENSPVMGAEAVSYLERGVEQIGDLLFDYSDINTKKNRLAGAGYLPEGEENFYRLAKKTGAIYNNNRERIDELIAGTLKPIKEYGIINTGDAGKANTELQGLLNMRDMGSLRAYDIHGKDISAEMSHQDLAGIKGALPKKLITTGNTVITESVDGVGITIRIPVPELQKLIGDAKIDTDNVGGAFIKDMMDNNSLGEIEFQWDDITEDHPAVAKFLEPQHRQRIKENRAIQSVTADEEVDSKTPNRAQEFKHVYNQMTQGQEDPVFLSSKFKGKHISLDFNTIAAKNSKNESDPADGFMFMVDNTPATIQEVFDRQSPHMDADMLEGFRKNLSQYQSLKEIQDLEDVKSLYDSASNQISKDKHLVDMKKMVEAGVATNKHKPYSFPSKGDLIVYASNELDRGDYTTDFTVNGTDVSPIANTIFETESGPEGAKSYNIQGSPGLEQKMAAEGKSDVTQFSLKELVDMEGIAAIDGAKGFLQIIPSTVDKILNNKRLREKYDLSPDNLFSIDTQVRLFYALLDARGLDEFMQTGDVDEFMWKLSKEWAGLPQGNKGASRVGQRREDGSLIDTSPNASYWKGVAKNAAGIDSTAFRRRLEEMYTAHR
jgi:hypothetical protein